MAQGMDVAEVEAFLNEHFPQALQAGFEIAEVGSDRAVIRLEAGHRHLRPGKTVMGPTLMMLADTAAYFAVLGRGGHGAAGATTTNLEMHFMRRAPASTLTCEATLLKLGRTLAVATVAIHSDAVDAMVAYATVTYALPSA